MNIILASQSPRRKEILSFFKIPFSVQVSGFDESTIRFKGNPAEYVMKQSLCKALALKDSYPDSIILSADTTVYFDGRIYEKPVSERQAKEFLYQLRSQTHHVFTGVSLVYGDKILQDYEETKVTFVDASDSEIDAYLKAVYPLDKAAGYAIQGPGSLLIDKIEGCYYNVMGLPIKCIVKLFKNCGIDLWEYAGK